MSIQVPHFQTVMELFLLQLVKFPTSRLAKYQSDSLLCLHNYIGVTDESASEMYNQTLHINSGIFSNQPALVQVGRQISLLPSIANP